MVHAACVPEVGAHELHKDSLERIKGECCRAPKAGQVYVCIVVQHLGTRYTYPGALSRGSFLWLLRISSDGNQLLGCGGLLWESHSPGC